MNHCNRFSAGRSTRLPGKSLGVAVHRVAWVGIGFVARYFLLIAFMFHGFSEEVWSAELDLRRFEGEIRRMERGDATNPPALRSVVFTGSSSVVRWRSLSNDFAGIPVLNRAFGGSTWRELNHYFLRVIPKCQPRAVVVYEGDNDLALGRTVGECLADFEEFRRLMREHLPGVPVAILAIKPSASRLQWRAAQEQLRRGIEERIKNDGNWALLDVASVVVDAAGKPRAELFEADRLHLNAAGYATWVPVVRPWVEKYGGP